MVDFFCFLLYNLDGDYMNNNKIYNVVFPIWFFIIVTLGWLFVLPINFLIDSLVLLIILKLMKMPLKKIYGKTILKIWLFGFLADFIGALFLMLLDFAPLGDLFSDLYWNPYNNIYAVIIIIVAILISGFFIYYFNYKYCFKKIDIEEKSKRKIALFLAIFTMPYLFLVPTKFLYGDHSRQYMDKDMMINDRFDDYNYNNYLRK